ncbi:endo-1,4-beta-xylanase [Reinekea sp.]|jgi:endo-1,4-beta-xylanase|uniref:endo-1,4-beta-xylanase n=1 Tax=Reinekea sp. TaxID=1970455 RepID=UPI003989BB1E
MKTTIILTTLFLCSTTLFASDNQWLEVINNSSINFGVAVESRYLDNPLYASQLIKNFNTITPENSAKWESIHPKRNQYDFTGMDEIVNFAQEHDLQIRGHTLVWHMQNPGWLTNGMWLESEAREVMNEHINTVVTRYAGKIDRWDVVNEALDDRGELRKSSWYFLLGDHYIDEAFKAANAADPGAILYYNDYGISDCGEKADGSYHLMKDLLSRDVPIHGIGLQGHFDVSSPVDLHCLNDNINRFGELGLEVQLTELDIRLKVDEIDADLLQDQQNQYAQILGLLASNPYLNGVTVWGLSDAHSWVPHWFNGQGSALLFDDQLNEKSMLKDLKKGFIDIINDGVFFQLPAKRAKNLRSFPVFIASEKTEQVEIDQLSAPEFWQNVPVYPLGFNQLNPKKPWNPSKKDIDGSWQVAYINNSLIGRLHRVDDITSDINKTAIWENDCVEVFIKWENKYYQFRALVGQTFADISFPGIANALWSDSGDYVYFKIDFPNVTDIKGETIAWNIALSDVDKKGASREVQLYPVPGTNRSWVGKDLAELHFTGHNLPPSNESRGVVAPLNAQKMTLPNVSAGIQDRIEQYPLTFPIGDSNLSLMRDVIVQLTWDDSGLMAVIGLPEEVVAISTEIDIKDQTARQDVIDAKTSRIHTKAPLEANQFLRIRVKATYETASGESYTYSLAPNNGYIDVRTQ